MVVKIGNDNAELLARSIIESVIDAHVNGDHQRIVELIPGLPADDFNEAVAKLSPLGKVVSIDYLGHLNKVKEHLLLWKVSFERGEEEILWHLYLAGDERRVEPIGLLFDL